MGSPLEFTQRLAALVPRPGLYPVNFYGVLAPSVKLRALAGGSHPRALLER